MVKLKETKPAIIKLLYQMMFDIHQILVNNGIKYWVDGGTLLGAVRHQGIIPWDDDLDIGLLSKDYRKLKEIEKDFNKCGYRLVKHWLGYKICYKNRKNIPDFDYSFPFMDIVSYKKEGEKIIPSLKTVRESWPNGYFEVKDTFPLVEYEFGDINVLGPKNSKPYLNRMYGKDWKKVAYRQYDHQKEEEVESIKVKLSSNMLKAAKPYNQIKNRNCVKLCLKNAEKKQLNPNYWKQKKSEYCTTGNCFNNFSTKMGVFVVNCAMHKTRYEKFKKYAKKANVKACRVPCVLGTKFDQNVMCNMIKNKLVSTNCDMTTIEISINMSHYNCWQKLINSCKDYAMILEDDVELKPDFINRVNGIMDALHQKNIDFSVLHLWNGNWAETSKYHTNVLKVGDMTIVKETTDYNAGAAAYIISRKYAEFLMKKFFPIKMPQDMMMGEYPDYGNHLSLKMKYRSKDACYLSPLLDMECGGEGGTGTQTTQEHSAPTVKERWSCKKC
jgi:phosphorylcholine metabolism protein LicD/GR25 family glycosyltransferase involved in LPS biosynthesis